MKQYYYKPQVEVLQFDTEEIMYPKAGSPGGGGGKPQPAPGRMDGSGVKLTTMYV